MQQKSDILLKGPPAALAGRAAISVVNWAEVLSKTAERGGDPIALEAEYREKGFIGEALAIEVLSEADCVEIDASADVSGVDQEVAQSSGVAPMAPTFQAPSS